MTNKRATDILATLATIRNTCAEQLLRDEGNPVFQVRSSLTSAIFNAASHLKPEVLEEIYRFHEQLAEHNGSALLILDRTGTGAKEAYANTALATFAQSLTAHIGSDTVQPELMPWQYRK